jgi:hypothetical protein
MSTLQLPDSRPGLAFDPGSGPGCATEWVNFQVYFLTLLLKSGTFFVVRLSIELEDTEKRR